MTQNLRLMPFLCGCARLTLAGGAVAAAVFIGWYVGAMLHLELNLQVLNGFPPENVDIDKLLGGMTIGGAIALATKGMDGAEQLKNFVTNQEQWRFWRPVLGVFATAMLFGLSDLPKENERASAAALQAPRSTILMGFSPKTELSISSLGVFSVYFKEGQVQGAALSPDFLRDLDKAITACAEPDRRVKVLIRGFSSSSEFTSNSDQKNVELANQRAQSVGLLQNPLLDVEIENWAHGVADWSEARARMRAAAGFLDRVEGSFNVHRGFFNRRVDIIVKDPGACTTSHEE